MAGGLSVSVSIPDLATIREDNRTVREDVLRAANVRALNRTADRVRTRAVDAISLESRLPKAAVRKRIKITGARLAAPGASLWFLVTPLRPDEIGTVRALKRSPVVVVGSGANARRFTRVFVMDTRRTKGKTRYFKRGLKSGGFDFEAPASAKLVGRLPIAKVSVPIKNGRARVEAAGGPTAAEDYMRELSRQIELLTVERTRYRLT